jgi:hypothetical protein
MLLLYYESFGSSMLVFLCYVVYQYQCVAFTSFEGQDQLVSYTCFTWKQTLFPSSFKPNISSFLVPTIITGVVLPYADSVQVIASVILCGYLANTNALFF